MTSKLLTRLRAPAPCIALDEPQSVHGLNQIGTASEAVNMSPMDISGFAAGQLQLLERELQVEMAETTTLMSQFAPASMQRAGLAILNLQVGSQRTGFGGKTLLDLEIDPALGGADLPEHSIRVGDIVSVQEQVSGSARKKEKEETRKRGVDGVITKVTPNTISVALDKEEVDVPGGRLWLCVRYHSIKYLCTDCRQGQNWRTM